MFHQIAVLPRALLAGMLGLLVFAGPIAAEQTPPGATDQKSVTFQDSESSFTLTGQLLSYDGLYARIQTENGPVTVATEGLDCVGAGCPDANTAKPTLRLSGVPEMTRVLLPALIERYALSAGMRVQKSESAPATTLFSLSRPDAVFDISVTTDTQAAAIADQKEGRVDIVLALSEPDGTQARQLRVVALDGLVPAVARANPLRKISLAALQQVLSGAVTDWSELGHPEGGPIRLLGSQSPKDGFLGLPLPAPTPFPNSVSARPLSMADRIASDPSAFGLVRASQLGLARALALEGACGRPIGANATRLKAEDYPLHAPLLLVLPQRRLPRGSKAFLQFFETPAAQLVVRRAGYVDQMPDRVPMVQQGQRLVNAVAAAGRNGAASLADMQELVAGLAGAERLTTTFRFRDGGAELDAQSSGNIERLARMLATGRLTGTEMIFAGFGDGTGPAPRNKELSLERAQAVRGAVQAQLEQLSAGPPPLELSVQGHGEVLPMGCDDSAWGRQVNRRVEVWLR